MESRSIPSAGLTTIVVAASAVLGEFFSSDFFPPAWCSKGKVERLYRLSLDSGFASLDYLASPNNPLSQNQFPLNQLLCQLIAPVSYLDPSISVGP